MAALTPPKKPIAGPGNPHAQPKQPGVDGGCIDPQRNRGAELEHAPEARSSDVLLEECGHLTLGGERGDECLAASQDCGRDEAGEEDTQADDGKDARVRAT